MSNHLLEDEDDLKGQYPESPVAIQYRMKELGRLRKEVILKESWIKELQERIKDLKTLLQEEVIELRQCRGRLTKEEARFEKQGDTIARQSRKRWKRNSFMEVYSNSRQKWFLAECKDIFEDAEGEWLQVMFCDKENGQTIMKQIQRFSQELRPCEIDRTPPIGAQMPAPALQIIHELPRKEAEEYNSWSEYHDKRQPEIPISSFEKQQPQQPRDRRQSAAISEEMETVINEISGDKLFIMYQNQAHEIYASLQNPVSHLMQRISIKLHVESELQTLLFEDVPLKRNEIISNYNIRKGSTLFLTVNEKITQKRIRTGRAARGSTADFYQDHCHHDFMKAKNLATFEKMKPL